MNKTWGFNIADDNYKSTKELLHLLIRTAGTGANLLLNVGPMPNGRIQEECTDRLKEMGEWMDKYGYTIYGTDKGWVKPQEWGAVTHKGKEYYIHILDDKTKSIELHIPNIKSAQWIDTDVPFTWKKDRKTGNVTFTFAEELDPIDSLMKVTVK